jgi:hypothetical protein
MSGTMTDGTDAAAEVATQPAGQDGADVEGTPADASASAHPEAIGRRWYDPISVKRQGELLAIRDAWDASDADHGERRGPFDGVPLTGADVAWLVEQVRDENGRVPNLHLEGARLYQAYLETLRHMESFE